jgi:glutathione synthase/RimK-type ligase-like ATP-grasp enzyme
MKLYPYTAGSQSAKDLAAALGIKRLHREGEEFNLKGQTVINWGCSVLKRSLVGGSFLNKPEAIAIAANKLKAFKAMHGHVGIPLFTESREEAIEWQQLGHIVVVRHLLSGHSGEGIELVATEAVQMPEAPLYTCYVKKKEEYRIHVNGGVAFFVQRKARNKEIPDEKVNWQVRNHGNGFIFAHQDVDAPDVAKEQAIMAVKAIGLDFGAVDIIQNTVTKAWVVLEVNTACGLTGGTLKKYVEQFKGYV